MFKIQFKIGKNPIAIENESLTQLFLDCGVFARVPNTCGKCGADDLIPNGVKMTGKGFTFFSIHCRGCGSELRFGQRIADQGLFLKEGEGWKPPYQTEDESPRREINRDEY